jgi:hypothetical protein
MVSTIAIRARSVSISSVVGISKIP